MIKGVTELLETMGTWSVLLPSILGFFLFRYLSKSSKIIWITSVLASIPQMVSIVPFMAGRRYAFYNMYVIIEFVLTAFLLIELINDRKAAFRIILVYAVSFFLLFFWLLINEDISRRFFFECVALTNLMMVTGVLLIIYDAIRNTTFILNWKQPDIYYIIGLFFYSPVTVLMYTLWKFLHAHESSPLNNLWIIHYIANTSMYCLFAMGISKNNIQRVESR